MSTFSGLGIAASGLSAARAALEVTGQNVANANTEGYTRQRVVQSPIAQTALATHVQQNGNGDGVVVTGVARLNDAVVDARVNSTASGASYWSATANAVSTVETSLNEPTTNGLASQLNTFWNDWQVVANDIGTAASSGAATQLIQQGALVASTIAGGYDAARNAWSDARAGAVSTAAAINSAAASVADLNTTIRSLSASGGTVNSLLDQRDAAVTSLAKLTGASTRSNADGTVDVVVGGNSLVSGVTARPVRLSGAQDFSEAAAGTGVSLVWSDAPSSKVSLDGGEMAGRLASLQPATTGGTGGVFAEAAQAYNTIATTVADSVNTIHAAGANAAGTTGLNFFSYSSAGTAASTLSVVPTSGAGIATAAVGKGANDATVADAIAQLGTGATSPNATWASYVSRVGSQSATATARASTSTTAATAATTAQTSVSGVDLDEETSNLVIYQHAYQASARVISTINDVLDTLINMGAR
jgi:flagellar hook-associated protein 1 FlgK